MGSAETESESLRDMEVHMSNKAVFSEHIASMKICAGEYLNVHGMRDHYACGFIRGILLRKDIPSLRERLTADDATP